MKRAACLPLNDRGVQYVEIDLLNPWASTTQELFNVQGFYVRS